MVLGDMETEVHKTTLEHTNVCQMYNAEILELKSSIARLQLELDSAEQDKHRFLLAQTEHAFKQKAFAGKFHKFTNSLNNDMQRERAIAQEQHEKINELVLEAKTLSEDLKQTKEQLAIASQCITAVNTKALNTVRDAQISQYQLETDKAALREQLDIKKKELDHLSSEQDHLRTQLEQQRGEYSKLELLLGSNRDMVMSKLLEFKIALEALNDPSTSFQVSEITKATQKILAVESVSPQAIDGIREVLGGLERNVLAQLAELKPLASPSHDQGTSSVDIPEQIREHIILIKSEIIQWQSLQEQVTSLREDKATTNERLKAQERQIVELTEQVKAAKLKEDMLQGKNDELLKQLRHLVPIETNANNTSREDLVEQQRLRAALEEREEVLQAETVALKATLTSKEDNIKALACKLNDTQREVCRPVYYFRRLLIMFRA
jgi:chromosome segregation ATPase